MTLASEYRRQFGWRDWPAIFGALPDLHGQTVLDIGCGVGDQAAELVARGAHVIGLDGNQDLIAEARARALPNAEFRHSDLCADPGIVADGVWSSFTAAYFPDLPAALATWTRGLRPGGFIALTEVDDLFGHHPLTQTTTSLLAEYAQESLQAKRYDFHMGYKLERFAQQAGFKVSTVLTLSDQELSFDGPALPDVVDAWRARFDRMKLLQERCGAQFESLREDFLACLKHENHRSGARVYCCIARR